MCIFPVRACHPGMQGLNVPNVCPEQPSGSTIFCEEHCLLAEQRGHPLHVKEFLQYCGASQTAGKIFAALSASTCIYMVVL